MTCLLSMLVALGGCSLRDIIDQSERIDAVGTLQGVVTATRVSQRDVVVALLREKDAHQLVLYRTVTPDRTGAFSLSVPAGEFYVGAFVDENHDGHFQPGEPGQFYGQPTFVKVAAKDSVTVALTLSPTSRPTGLNLPVDDPQRPEVGGNTGVVTTLDDPRFDPGNGMLGMWRPLDFVAGPQGGLYMLAEYDPDRIPVLFVHGIAGTPRDFAGTIERIDLRRYQPWVLYYPSGVRLDMVSNGLVSAMHQLRRRYGFTQYALVAHSMGGLVARSYVQKYAERYPDEAPSLRVFVTVNSPFGGMSSAARAVENSPVVVPSWQDVAEGSDFLRGLERSTLPAGLPYFLVFSFDGDDNGDGTVPLTSQLPTVFQAQAQRLYGFENSHVGTLSNPEFSALLNRLLDAAVVRVPARH